MNTLQKRAVANYYTWKRSNMDSIYKAYCKPSYAKVRAWDYCKNLCSKFGGKNLKVVNHGCQLFSAGFEFEDENGIPSFMFITKSTNTAVAIPT